MSRLTIAHLYPEAMNIYGDTGNVIALARRLEWRGLEVAVDRIAVGMPYDFTRADIVVAGGGEDRSQGQVATDLAQRSGGIREAAAAGVVFLAICGTYQLLGHRFVTAAGSEMPGIGLFDMETFAEPGRMIGNIVVDTAWGSIVGFENHSGRTHLAPGQHALGSVVRGHGNNGKTGDEGAVTGNVFGSYLHGAMLPKNPAFADELIGRALRRRFGETAAVETLDDSLEERAAAAAASRP